MGKIKIQKKFSLCCRTKKHVFCSFQGETKFEDEFESLFFPYQSIHQDISRNLASQESLSLLVNSQALMKKKTLPFDRLQDLEEDFWVVELLKGMLENTSTSVCVFVHQHMHSHVGEIISMNTVATFKYR